MKEGLACTFLLLGRICRSIADGAFAIGLLLGAALTICEGFGAISIGWFWATFPFWAWAGPLVAGVCLTVIAYLIGDSL